MSRAVVSLRPSLLRRRRRRHSTKGVYYRQTHVGQRQLRLVVDDPALVLVLLGHDAGDDSVAEVPESTLGAHGVRLAVLVRGAGAAGVPLEHGIGHVVLEDVE